MTSPRTSPTVPSVRFRTSYQSPPTSEPSRSGSGRRPPAREPAADVGQQRPLEQPGGRAAVLEQLGPRERLGELGPTVSRSPGRRRSEDRERSSRCQVPTFVVPVRSGSATGRPSPATGQSDGSASCGAGSRGRAAAANSLPPPRREDRAGGCVETSSRTDSTQSTTSSTVTVRARAAVAAARASARRRWACSSVTSSMRPIHSTDAAVGADQPDHAGDQVPVAPIRRPDPERRRSTVAPANACSRPAREIAIRSSGWTSSHQSNPRTGVVRPVRARQPGRSSSRAPSGPRRRTSRASASTRARKGVSSDRPMTARGAAVNSADGDSLPVLDSERRRRPAVVPAGGVEPAGRHECRSRRHRQPPSACSCPHPREQHGLPSALRSRSGGSRSRSAPSEFLSAR